MSILQHNRNRLPGLVNTDIGEALYYHTTHSSGWYMNWTKSGGKVYYDLGDGTTGSDQSVVNHNFADTSDKLIKI